MALPTGHIASKSRWRRNSRDNLGGFTIVDFNNHCVGGDRWELTAQEVIEWFRNYK